MEYAEDQARCNRRYAFKEKVNSGALALASSNQVRLALEEKHFQSQMNVFVSNAYLL